MGHVSFYFTTYVKALLKSQFSHIQTSLAHYIISFTFFSCYDLVFTFYDSFVIKLVFKVMSSKMYCDLRKSSFKLIFAIQSKFRFDI